MCVLLELITGFTEYPTNLTLLLVESEIKALFRCGYWRSVIFSWMVNGLLFTDFPGAEEVLVNENGTRVSTLTIPAIQENNGTVVVCLAGSFGGSIKETPPVTLILMAGC